MIKLLRVIVALAFVAVSAVFIEYYLTEIRTKDDTIPKIEISGDIVEVKSKESRKELLKGVTAYDEKDGDLTDRVIVESISRFIEPGVCKISYAVCDNNNHVARATRKVRYKKYTPPKFTLSRPLLFYVGETVNLSAIVGATDFLDGNIDNNVIVTSSDYKSGQIGTFHAELKVTNSKGDIVFLTVPVIVEEGVIDAPVIELEKNIIYTKYKNSFDFQKYVKSITDYDGNQISLSNLVIDSNVSKREGVYSVHYSVTDRKGRRGSTVLTVVVEK